MHTAPFSTLRRPFVRYSALLNGPNQQIEDGLQAWERATLQSQRTAPASFASVKSSSDAGDAELECLSRQFHDLKAIIEKELSRSPEFPRGPAMVMGSPEEKENDEEQGDEMGAPAAGTALSPVFEGELESSPPAERCATGHVEWTVPFARCDSLPLRSELDDGLEEPTALMRHAATLSTAGFVPTAAVASRASTDEPVATGEPPSPYSPRQPTRDEQRWLERRMSEAEHAAVDAALEAVEAAAGEVADARPDEEEQRWLDRQLSDASLLEEAGRLSAEMDAKALAQAASACVSRVLAEAAADVAPSATPADAWPSPGGTSDAPRLGAMSAEELYAALARSKRQHRAKKATAAKRHA